MSDHHKKHRNIISNRKAFSSIVGAIFAILIIVSLTGTFFVWSIQQNSRYVNAVSDINQMVMAQRRESINVTSSPVYIVGDDGEVLVAVEIQNDGPISVTVTTLWIQDLNGSKPFGYLPSLNRLLAPGDTWAINTIVQVPGAAEGDSFYGWIVTARGSIVPLYPAHAKGPAGLPGLPGTSGADGSKWYSEYSAPVDSIGINGDYYLNLLNGDVYKKVNNTWGTPIINIKGPAGLPGTSGADGSKWYAERSAPVDSIGINGDYYLNLLNGDVYKKVNNTWGAPIINIKGEPGPRGENGTTSYHAQTAMVAQGIGSIAMDFSAFRSYVVNSSQFIGPPVESYTVTTSPIYAFSVNVTNMDLRQRNINLTSNSCFWALTPPKGSGTPQIFGWYLSTVYYGRISLLPAGSFVTLPYNQTTTIYFYWNNNIGNSLNKGPAAVNLLLTGVAYNATTVTDYGQNLPFIALTVT